MDMLLVSVAPDVKTISFGSAPIKSATCYNRVYSKTVFENEFRNIYLASILDGFFCLPTIRMCATMWVPILVCEIWQHRVEYPRINWSCGLSANH